MRSWETAGVLYFLFVAGAGALQLRVPRSRRVRLLAAAAAGLVVVVAISRAPYLPILHDWLAAPAILLLAYWTSGLLFVSPRPGQERILSELDRRLRIARIARRLPPAATLLLEAAYLAVYPMIPIALVLYLWLTPGADAERFWTVILITDFVCFGALAWVQTRPPRVLEASPWLSSLRGFNLDIVGTASIQANTFPSGHAAEALAAALLLTGAPWPVVGAMFVAAAAISAGAVLGRYHYAADALAGWAVAAVVWLMAVRTFGR